MVTIYSPIFGLVLHRSIVFICWKNLKPSHLKTLLNSILSDLNCDSFYFRKKISMQQQVADAFISKFQLSHKQLNTLCDSNVSPSFFQALDRVHMIHAHCRTLMQSGLQTVALDIMEQMSAYQVQQFFPYCLCKNRKKNTIFIILIYSYIYFRK